MRMPYGSANCLRLLAISNRDAWNRAYRAIVELSKAEG
jgi:hypothetical protein